MCCLPFLSICLCVLPSLLIDLSLCAAFLSICLCVLPSLLIDLSLCAAFPSYRSVSVCCLPFLSICLCVLPSLLIDLSLCAAFPSYRSVSVCCLPFLSICLCVLPSYRSVSVCCLPFLSICLCVLPSLLIDLSLCAAFPSYRSVSVCCLPFLSICLCVLPSLLIDLSLCAAFPSYRSVSVCCLPFLSICQTSSLLNAFLCYNSPNISLSFARYLLTGEHIPAKHWRRIAVPDLCNDAAARFLGLIPDCCWRGEQMFIEHVQSTSSADASTPTSETSGNSHVPVCIVIGNSYQSHTVYEDHALHFFFFF